MKPITETPFTEDLLTLQQYWWNRTTPESLQAPAEPHFDKLLAIAQNERKIFSLIQTTLPTLDGWATVSKGCAMAALVLAMKPKLAVEIGTYAGRSFLPILWAMKKNGSGTAIGIDPYDAKVSAENEYSGSAEWWASLDHGLIEKRFRGFLRSFEVEQFAQIVKKKSDDVEPPQNIDFLHSDGCHTEPGFRDAERFGANVRLGGVAILDDVHWTGGSILRAEDALEDMGFVKRHIAHTDGDDYSILQRIRL